MVFLTLPEKCLANNAKEQVRNMEDLHVLWETLDTGFDRPEKYVIEALVPVIQFRKLREFNHASIL